MAKEDWVKPQVTLSKVAEYIESTGTYAHSLSLESPPVGEPSITIDGALTYSELMEVSRIINEEAHE